MIINKNHPNTKSRSERRLIRTGELPYDFWICRIQWLIVHLIPFLCSLMWIISEINLLWKLCSTSNISTLFQSKKWLKLQMCSDTTTTCSNLILCWTYVLLCVFSIASLFVRHMKHNPCKRFCRRHHYSPLFYVSLCSLIKRSKWFKHRWPQVISEFVMSLKSLKFQWYFWHKVTP